MSQIFTVRRPDDGVEVPLTCTPEQLKSVWEPQGYVLVGSETTDTAEEASSAERKGNSRAKK
jgi:hypothetical protein